MLLRIKIFPYLSQRNLKRKIEATFGGCALCNDTIESLDHIIVKCRFAGYTWSVLLAKLNIQSTPNNFYTFWTTWRSKDICMAFDQLCATFLWTYRKERNARIILNQAILEEEVLYFSLKLHNDWYILCNQKTTFLSL